MKKLTKEHGEKLLRLARMSIGSRLGQKGGETDSSQVEFTGHGGTFVTLKLNNQLRGCIGNITAVGSIWNSIKDNAVSAAFHDHRFSPLTEKEFGETRLSVSILTEPSPLSFKDSVDLCRKIRPNIDGVILRQGRCSATFLPQVWEQLPRVEDFLSHLCLKAGLSQNCWKNEDVEVQTYQVQSFTEEE